MLKVIAWIIFFVGLAATGFAGYEFFTLSAVRGVPGLPYRTVPMALLGCAFVAAGVYLHYTPIADVFKRLGLTQESKD